MAPLQDQDLFAIDSSGSQAVRSRLQSKPNARAGVLKSTDVLTNHSSTPALVSAKHARQREKDAVGMSKSEVRRLKDLVKRKEKAGQGLHGLPDERPIKGSSAAFEPEQGKYDMWSAEGSQKAPTIPVKAPVSLRRHEVLTEDVVPPSVQIPLPGQSYNPTHESHQELLSTANEAIQAHEASTQKTQAIKAQLDAARQARKGKELWELAQDEVAQAIEGDEAEVEQGDEHHPDEVIEKKRSNANKPKSAKDKKRRAHNINEQKKAEANKVLRKTQNVQLSNIPALIKELEAQTVLNARQKQAHLLALRSRLKREGLPTTIKRGGSGPSNGTGSTSTDIYQLEDELSESLRGLKQEGNLWKDWQESQVRRRKMPIVSAEQKFKKEGKTKMKERVDFRLWDQKQKLH